MQEDAQRLALGKFKGRRIRIDAVIDTINKQYELITKKFRKLVICLKNVIVNKGELSFSHLWIELDNEPDGLKEGDNISLTGEVYGYCRASGLRSYTVRDVVIK